MTGRIRETVTNHKRSSKETVSHTVLGEQLKLGTGADIPLTHQLTYPFRKEITRGIFKKKTTPQVNIHLHNSHN